jgi:drug/metabolite transporter (DMT)-like permease
MPQPEIPGPVLAPAGQDRPGGRVWVWLMVLITAVWGWTFVAIHDAVATLSPSAFVTYRFLAAALVMAIALLPVLRRTTLAELAGGTLAGAVLFVGYALQTLGLTSTTPSNAAFITGMSVVFTPVLLAVVFRVRPQRRAVISVVLAVVGLALLTMHGLAVHRGDLLVLGCAVALGGHVVVLSRVSPIGHPGRLTLIQLATVGLLGLAWSGATGDLVRPVGSQAWIALAVTALVASAFAFFVQTKAQAMAAPTRIAVILTLEPVFGGLFGYWLSGDRFTLLNLLGAVLILGAMLIMDLKRRSFRKRARLP